MKMALRHCRKFAKELWVTATTSYECFEIQEVCARQHIRLNPNKVEGLQMMFSKPI